MPYLWLFPLHVNIPSYIFILFQQTAIDVKSGSLTPNRDRKKGVNFTTMLSVQLSRLK